MTVQGKGRSQSGGSAWTWIAAGIAVLIARVVLMAAGAVDDGGPLAVIAAALVVVGLVRGTMDWLDRRGR